MGIKAISGGSLQTAYSGIGTQTAAQSAAVEAVKRSGAVAGQSQQASGDPYQGTQLKKPTDTQEVMSSGSDSLPRQSKLAQPGSAELVLSEGSQLLAQTAEKAPVDVDGAVKDSIESFQKYQEALSKLSKEVHGSTLSFSYHEETNRVMFKVIDDQTKEVIREVPAEKVLDAVAKLWEVAGIVVDEKR